MLDASIRYSTVLDTLADVPAFSYIPRSFVIAVPAGSTAVLLSITQRQDNGFWLVRNLQIAAASGAPPTLPSPPPPPALIKACYGVGANPYSPYHPDN